MNKSLRDILIILVFSLVSAFCSLKLDDFFMNTIYTVSGIMFSIGLGLIVTFNLQGVKNKMVVRQLRSTLNILRNSYIKYFSFTTAAYILDKYLREKGISMYEIKIFEKHSITIDFSLFFCLTILYSIVYYIYNFIAIQKLNNDIYDHLNN